MLLGRYENSIDAKNRMIIPSKFREDLGYKAILTKGLDDCLILFPVSTWEKQEEILSSLPSSDPKARAYKRFIYSNASDCEIDKQGRILIPASLRAAAGLNKELITIGSLDRIEIWAKDKFEGSENGGKLSAEDFADFSDKYQV